jgi:fructokinase
MTAMLRFKVAGIGELLWDLLPKVKIADNVGAGDSFTAAMIVGFAKGESLNELNQKAVDISAFVCTQDGAMPEYDNIQIFK